MNKSELIDAIAAKNPSASKKAIGDILEGFIAVVGETLKKGEPITLVGFGTFEARQRAARTGRNPQTGKEIKIAASTVPAFRPGAGLKKTLGNGQ